MGQRLAGGGRIAGRVSGQLRLQIAAHTDKATLQPFVGRNTGAESTVDTDEWKAYGGLGETGRTRATVCHAPGQREWARDDNDGDGDGIREVHSNTVEGTWTGLRNFLRPFRGDSKGFLAQYVALFEWSHNIKGVDDNVLSVLLGVYAQPPVEADTRQTPWAETTMARTVLCGYSAHTRIRRCPARNQPNSRTGLRGCPLSGTGCNPVNA